MASLNKVLIIGHLGKDPDTRYLPDGNATATISVATTETWKDKAGEKKEQTEWHRIVFFGRIAEVASQYLKKGALVYVEGRIQTRKWDDKDGNTRYVTEIVGRELKMLGGKPDGESKPATAGADYEAAKSGEKSAAPRQPSKPGSFDHMDDDIPF